METEERGMAARRRSDAAGSVRHLLAPQVVAVIGASRDPKKWGHRVIEHSLQMGYAGRIYAVNPAADGPIAGVPAVPSVGAIPERVDCAFIALPARLVPDAVEECAAVAVRTAVVASAGFAEIGAEGRQTQERMLRIARRAGLRVIGPNCFGIFHAPASLALLPYRNVPRGPIALIAQSGNLTLALFQLAQRAGTGFSTVVGLGNQMDLTFTEVLEYLAADPVIRAVALYVEGLPPGTGQGFAAALERFRAAGKPVAVLKVGTSRTGAAVAASHTGMLASDDRLWTEMLRGTGAVRVGSPEELVDVLRVGMAFPRAAHRIALVTDGGGDSLLATDAVENSNGLSLARYTADTATALRPLLPPLAPRSPGLNPLTLDTPGGVEDDPRLFARCAEILSHDPGVDATLVAGVLGVYRDLDAEQHETVRELARLARRGVPIAVASSILTPEDPLWHALREAGAPIFQDVVRMVGAVARWVDTDGPGEHAAYRHAPDASKDGAGTTWDAKEAATFLRAAGVPIPDFRIARTAEQAANRAKGLGGPACLKALVPDLSHKSDQGGVVLGLTDAAETRRAAQTLLARFPGARLLVMRSYPPGPELFAGARTDAVYGPTLVVGRGGIWTEVEDDIALLPAGSSQAAIEGALKTLRMAPLLLGYRGQPPCDLAAVAEIASALGSAIMNRPTLFVDLNPVLLVGGKPVVVDWRVVEA